MLSIDPVMDTISLSAGGEFKVPSWQLRGDFPAGSEAYVVFYDDAGAVLAQFDGVVDSIGVSFLQPPADVKDIPHNAKFNLYVVLPGEDPLLFRYGTVARKESRFPLTTLVRPEDSAKQYTASFANKYIGPLWVPMGGSTSLSIHEHPVLNLPPSMGPDFSLYSKTAARWLFPMNMDSVTINTSILKVGVGSFGNGNMNVIVCSDYAMTKWMAVQFHIDVVDDNSYVAVIVGSGPTDWKMQGDPVKNVFSAQDSYTVKYNAMSNTLSCYRGSSLTPLIEWVDSDNQVPHGDGFRYTGLAWRADLFTPVVEATAWEAHDGV